MAFYLTQRILPFIVPSLGRPAGLRRYPERVTLDVKSDVLPSRKPPVRIFLGTEPAQHRAERVFIWSIEQVRDPSRVYEIHLMKELVGFDRRRWLTGFTNYRFAVPEFAGRSGRAIYNDVDQIYLVDPAALFDAEMGAHGYLSITPDDASVMLVDCAQMAPLWNLTRARHRTAKALLGDAHAVVGLWGKLAPEWNARDTQYSPGHSRVVHYTVLHTQPWRPFPNDYVYLDNPAAGPWHALESAADAAGSHVFTGRHPSEHYRSLLTAANVSGSKVDANASRILGHRAGAPLQPLLRTGRIQSVLYCPALAGEDRTAFRLELAVPVLESRPEVTQMSLICAVAPDKTSMREFDAVVCIDAFASLAEEDVPWVTEALFARAHRLLYVEGGDSVDRWRRHLRTIGARYPAVHWQLVVRRSRWPRREVISLRHGGKLIGGAPRVWILADHKAGHTTQSVGLAEALGWPYEIKRLRFHRYLAVLPVRLLGIVARASLMLARQNGQRLDTLNAPWPDVVIATGWQPARVARWLKACTSGQMQLVLMGRKVGPVTDGSDVAVACAHFRLLAHPRRLKIVLPLNRVTPARLQTAAVGRATLFGDAPRPHVALLVGGESDTHRFDPDTALRMGREVAERVRAAGGSLLVMTSRRTGAAAEQALKKGMAAFGHLHAWREGDRDNPYLACLSWAQTLIVTGESESMLAEAAAAGKSLYIYPLPERTPHLWRRLSERVLQRAYAKPVNRRGTARPQQGLEYLCARLIQHGIVRPPRKLDALHRDLIERGIARRFGAPLETGCRRPWNETAHVASQVHALLGLSSGADDAVAADDRHTGDSG